MYRIEYEDLNQQVHALLKRMILTGELKPGQHLAQDDLAERLGVSRTPLLSALSKLEREMLIESKPRRGNFVRSYSRLELLNIYDIRLRLEPLGTHDATRNGTDDELDEVEHLTKEYEQAVAIGDPGQIKSKDYEFHMLLMHMSRNTFLYNIVSSNNIVLIANVRGLLKDPKESLAQHRSIVAALRSRDPDMAEEQMYHHIFTSRSNLVHIHESELERSEERMKYQQQS